MARFNYVELPVGDVPATKAFYEAAFGWRLTDFGPSYAATLTGDTDIGLQGDATAAARAPRRAARGGARTAARWRCGGAALGGRLTGVGPGYAAALAGDTDVGLQGDAAEASRAPLPV